MKRLVFFLGLFLALAAAFAQSDRENCADHPLIPARIPGYYIGECENNDFSTHVVATETGEKTVEGKKTVLQYFLKTGARGVSETYVVRNYLEAIKKQNGKVLLESGSRGVAFARRPDGSEVWVDVAGYVGDGTPEETGHYYLTVVEVAAMEQVITAAGLAGDLRNTGKAVLYIQFETGKSVIKPESFPILEQMARMLLADKTLKVYIVGHTDNTGTLELNQKLSEERAAAVAAALTAKHAVPASQLLARGVGPLAPIASNSSEDGRKLNRRVELVKQ